jgi:Tfp pilus assembly pilus retraction ATPase PilT
MTGASEGMQTLEMALTTLISTGLCDHEEAVNHSLHPKEVLARTA